MSTHYGLQIDSPFDIRSLSPVVIVVKKGETKNIDRAAATGLLAIIVEENATLVYTESISEGGIYHTYVYLRGENSQITISSKVNIEKEVADISHQVLHEKSQSTSSIKARAVVGESGLVIYTSNISVAPNISKIEGLQDAQFIITDPSARIKAVPGLAVYSDEVACSHKISIIPVDTNAVEFLAARGYTRAQAGQMLIIAFLN